MKLNTHHSLSTPKILLVPYSPHHVPQYHTWMQNPQLQKLTASEPLSIEEEYAMQKSWREDGDKLTFIVCLPAATTTTTGIQVKEGEGELEGKNGDANSEMESMAVQGGLGDADARMIGDVNLFLSQDDEDENEAEDKRGKGVIGEIEIMIATQSARGKGYGKATLLTFLWYIMQNLSAILFEYSKNRNSALKFLRVKIDADNQTSINLFEKAGFRKTSQTPNYFNEIELRLSPADTASLFKDMQEPSMALYKLPAAAKEAQ